MISSAWDKRIVRARELAGIHCFAAEILNFYGEILGFQKWFYERLSDRSFTVVARSDLRFGELLTLVRRVGPPALAQRARELSSRDFLACWNSDYPDHFFARAVLQPYHEYLASRSDVVLNIARSDCPFCGERPQLGVLRGEGEGAKRSLICSLCATEWEYRRLVCPGCGEEAVDKLPVYTTSEFDYVRVEACDSCHTYIKSVDMTKNGLAVPVVDELATIPLNIWADENGYAKLQLNLLGL